MRLNNILSSFIAIGFVVLAPSSILAQQPTSSPTGNGNSSKPRPKDVSPIVVRDILKKAEPPKKIAAIPSAATEAYTPKIKAITFDLTNPPDLTGTKWFEKIKEPKGLSINTVTFNQNGIIGFEHLGDRIQQLSGIWRQVGADIFVSLNFEGEPANGKVFVNCRWTFREGGNVYGFCKRPNENNVAFEMNLISDLISTYSEQGERYEHWEEYGT